jgi:hypothetical protein
MCVRFATYLANQLSSRPGCVDNPVDHRPQHIHAVPSKDFLVALDGTVINLSQRTTSPVKFQRGPALGPGRPRSGLVDGACTTVAKTGAGEPGPDSSMARAPRSRRPVRASPARVISIASTCCCPALVAQPQRCIIDPERRQGRSGAARPSSPRDRGAQRPVGGAPHPSGRRGLRPAAVDRPRRRPLRRCSG